MPKGQEPLTTNNAGTAACAAVRAKANETLAGHIESARLTDDLIQGFVVVALDAARDVRNNA